MITLKNNNLMTPDLFTHGMIGRICIHIKTQTPCMILDADWYNGIINFDVVVPQTNEKGHVDFCNATYSENEIKIIEK